MLCYYFSSCETTELFSVVMMFRKGERQRGKHIFVSRPEERHQRDDKFVVYKTEKILSESPQDKKPLSHNQHTSLLSNTLSFVNSILREGRLFYHTISFTEEFKNMRWSVNFKEETRVYTV